MLFRKRKRMVDLRELQKKGVVKIPRRSVDIPSSSVSKEGFVDLNSIKETSTTDNLSGPSPSADKTSSNASFFGFMDNTSPSPSQSSDNFSTEANGYTKREVDSKIIDLDNKIYKLEQRLELLEKKLEVNSSSSSSTGPMGW